MLVTQVGGGGGGGGTKRAAFAASKAKHKRRAACAECYRLREKCVFDDEDDAEGPCQRCAKLDKACRAREPGSRPARDAASKLRRDRHNACAECHRARGKCVWGKPGACDRCTALGKPCLPHIAIRGVAHNKGEFDDDLLRGCSSVRELCSFADDSADLARTRKAAADVPTYVHELQLDAVPPITIGSLRYMFFVAKELGSLKRLHKTTSMAAAMGALSAGDALDTDVPLLPQSHVDCLTTLAIEHFRLNDPLTAAFYVTSNVGRRVLHCTSTYGLFSSQETLEAQLRAGCSPVLESWVSFILDKDKAQRVANQHMADLVKSAVCMDTEYGVALVSGTEESTLTAVDLAGARFEVTFSLAVALQEDGRYYFGAVRMRDLKPLDKLASDRLRSVLSAGVRKGAQAGDRPSG